MTKRQLSREHLEKLKKGRASRSEKVGLVCIFGEHLQIWSDSRQFILKADRKPDSYHPNLEDAFKAAAEQKFKELATQQTQKDINGMLEAIKQHRAWLEEAIKQMLDANPRGR